MKILVVGSGAREHALCWKIKQSPDVEEVFCAPGNGGISLLAECVNIKLDDIEGLVKFAEEKHIDLTVVGPEAPLAIGIVDEFKKRNLGIFGPDKKAAMLEASKVFTKELLSRHGIPTASYRVFDDFAAACLEMEKRSFPCVIKADGLAQGKGVSVVRNKKEAVVFLEDLMLKEVFGKSGRRVIIEDCLVGEEASVMVITDGETIFPLASSQDHKRVFDNDEGPNTGGMGAYSPTPVVDRQAFNYILERIIQPLLKGLKKEGILYQGLLYAGLMLTKEGPMVLEFNVRFGDPETEVVLPRLKGDLAQLLYAVSEGKLGSYLQEHKGVLDWDRRVCICVVCASAGYPGSYERDKEINGLDKLKYREDVFVFHAGTKRIFLNNEEKWLTAGGRVLAVTALAEDILQARQKVYEAVSRINFEGMHFRRDIGMRALRKEEKT